MVENSSNYQRWDMVLSPTNLKLEAQTSHVPWQTKQLLFWNLYKPVIEDAGVQDDNFKSQPWLIEVSWCAKKEQRSSEASSRVQDGAGEPQGL